MKVEIETAGSFEHTVVTLNGNAMPQLIECDFSFSLARGRRPVLFYVLGTKEQPRKAAQFSRYFGNDFQKYDELFPSEAQAQVTDGGAR